MQLLIQCSPTLVISLNLRPNFPSAVQSVGLASCSSSKLQMISISLCQKGVLQAELTVESQIVSEECFHDILTRHDALSWPI